MVLDANWRRSSRRGGWGACSVGSSCQAGLKRHMAMRISTLVHRARASAAKRSTANIDLGPDALASDKQ